jgi:hypothetical protein
MASFYTFSPSFDHVFHYSSKWTSLGVYHIPDTLVTGASLWTQRDEDRLEFLNDAILSMRADEIQDLQEYNNNGNMQRRKKRARFESRFASFEYNCKSWKIKFL